jgi:cell pole-organizing protein PopZ
MSGDAPKPPGASGAPGDPAMDDILASIRRILNEDEAPPAGTPAAATPDEPLELTEAMMVQPTDEHKPPPPALDEPDEEPLPPLGPESLMAPTIAAATTAAVGKLLRAVAQERGATLHRGGPTIEDVVREELRPMLKEWLDIHLPPLVERLVRSEVERVLGRALP